MGLRPAPNRNFLSCADREIVNGLDRMARDHGFRPGGIIIILQEGAMRLDSNWLFFNIEGLSSDPTLETAMSMLIANATAGRASRRSSQPSITVLDECWALLDSPTLAPEVVQLFRTARTARKRYALLLQLCGIILLRP